MIWCTFTYSHEFVDIGYSDGLTVNALLEVSEYIYINAEIGEKAFNYGTGVGIMSKHASAVVTLNEDNENNLITKLQANYYDVNYSFNCSFGYIKGNSLGYKFGAGYALSERLSVVASYSDKGAFVGFRRWIF